MFKRLGIRFIELTKPLVKRLAYAYDIAVYHHAEAVGTHALEFEDPVRAKALIPKSVIFNTMSGRIKVGRDTAFGDSVLVLTGKHLNIGQAEAARTDPLHVPEEGRDIEIGRGCFISSGAIIIGPVKIGDHAIVAAGAVVTKDVPERTMVAGVPARVIRTF
jgi:acetyltransferase-like isoleucine patch superfamily enzyme